jgi:hypothetical protein
LLDKWVEKQAKEMEDRAKKNSKGIKGSASAYDHDEVIIFEEEEWEEVLEEESYDEEDEE